MRFLQIKGFSEAHLLIAIFVAAIMIAACSGGGSSSSIGSSTTGSSTSSGGSGNDCGSIGSSGASTGNSGSTGVTGSSSLTLSLFAGNLGGPGDRDGVGANASFNQPSAIATDSAGNAYVADSSNDAIRKITPAGVVTTIAGGAQGSADGVGTAARFYNPSGIAVDSIGNIYVSDTINGTIRKITASGVVCTLAGSASIGAGSADGTGTAASFRLPGGLATDAAGNVYVADTGNSTVRKITPAGVVTTLAGKAGVAGSADGVGAAASFAAPEGLTVDSGGNVYVTDYDNNNIRKITSAGVVSTVAGTAGVAGSANGVASAASFNNPLGIAVDSAGNLYVADYFNCEIRSIAPSGAVTTLAGVAGACGDIDGTESVAQFNSPSGLALDNSGNILVSDVRSSTIRKITSAGPVTTLAGSAAVTGSANGSGAAASFSTTRGIAADAAGNLYVADYGNDTIRVITPSGMVTTIAGMPGVAGLTDGVGSAATLWNPSGVATDNAGNIYVADAEIRKITPGGAVTTIFNNAALDTAALVVPDSVLTANPHCIATDNSGNIYVGIGVLNGGDPHSPTMSGAFILKITPGGTATVFAGAPGTVGTSDGTAAAASFYDPVGIAIDAAGNLYVTDSYGNNSLIRKITPAGVVTTLAGTPGVIGSADGTGAAASFNDPIGIAVDSAGDLYVVDAGNNTVRKITAAGVVSTVVGTPQPGNPPGFLPGTLPGGLSQPFGIAISGGSLYITMLNGVAVVNNLP